LGDTPEKLKGPIGGDLETKHLFGCDDCQTTRLVSPVFLLRDVISLPPFEGMRKCRQQACINTSLSFEGIRLVLRLYISQSRYGFHTT